MGAAAPTDGKRVLSAAGSPEGSRPSGKVNPRGRWEFPEKLPYLVLQITTAMQPRPQAPTVKGAGGFKGQRRRGEHREIYGGRSLQSTHNLAIAHSGNPDIDPARLRRDYVLSLTGA